MSRTEYFKQYYIKNKERLKAYYKEYQKKNNEVLVQRSRDYRKNNREKYNKQKRDKYRAKCLAKWDKIKQEKMLEQS